MPSLSLKALTATTGTRHDCWNTPQEIVDDVLIFFNHQLDLDPCSDLDTHPNIPAKRVYTEETNGLAHKWTAESVFMNHPYSESKIWIPYAVQQYKMGYAKELILLIKLDVSTKWWNSVSNYPWIAINKRLKFGSGKSAAPFQSAFIYLGEDLKRFKDVFDKYGTLYLPISYLNR